jgi:hypothetical protein|tara:strand:+ start:764 stop:976 length:213 start_codon:yes stop_codon:yes gene_type:complete
MSERMAKLYEKAWNKTVEGLNDYKKNIIINNYPYKDRHDKEIADDVIREAIRLAEKWDMELSGKVTTPAP